jgi:hypothetical protein
MTRFWKVFGVALVLAVLQSTVTAQPPTATPAPLNLSTVAPQEGEEVQNATSTWTATPEGQIMIEARDFANVRSEPDPNAAQLGQIRSGEQYPATGRYFEWIQFQFDANRRAWVFGQIVDVTGDVNSLPEIGVAVEPIVPVEGAGETQTMAAVTQTPGGVLTATAVARQNFVSGDLPANAGSTQSLGSVLPTFTYPPDMIAIAPTPGGSVIVATESTAPLIDTESGELPPIVPILVLGGMGLLGLAISSLRR